VIESRPGVSVERSGPARAAWFARDALEVAPDLLGGYFRVADATGVVVVRITEVEAYRGSDDPGSHAFRGRTPRNAVMFGPAGRIYVYFTYGMHWCANVVCGVEGSASAVLLRAGEVVEGADVARARRAAARRDADLARGPARLAAALGLTGADDGAHLGGVESRLSFVPAAERAREVASGPRVGVAGPGGDASAFPWRFWLPGEPTVSVYRPAGRRGAVRSRASAAGHGTAD
jgi:DNA-3-methyladenine glycosylase